MFICLDFFLSDWRRSWSSSLVFFFFFLDEKWHFFFYPSSHPSFYFGFLHLFRHVATFLFLSLSLSLYFGFFFRFLTICCLRFFKFLVPYVAPWVYGSNLSRRTPLFSSFIVMAIVLFKRRNPFSIFFFSFLLKKKCMSMVLTRTPPPHLFLKFLFILNQVGLKRFYKSLLVRCIFIFYFYLFVFEFPSAQCVDIATNSGGLSESGRSCSQLHGSGQCGSTSLRRSSSRPTFDNGRLRCRPRKVSRIISLFIYFSNSNLIECFFFFFETFSYGADPYLGHSIGPMPTYGISNSAELQSVNKLVIANNNKWNVWIGQVFWLRFICFHPQAAMYRSSYNRFTPY